MEEKGRRKTQEEEYGGGWGRRDMMHIKSIFRTIIDQKGISDTQLPNICYRLSSFHSVLIFTIKPNGQRPSRLHDVASGLLQYR